MAAAIVITSIPISMSMPVAFRPECLFYHFDSYNRHFHLDAYHYIYHSNGCGARSISVPVSMSMLAIRRSASLSNHLDDCSSRFISMVVSRTPSVTYRLAHLRYLLMTAAFGSMSVPTSGSISVISRLE